MGAHVLRLQSAELLALLQIADQDGAVLSAYDLSAWTEYEEHECPDQSTCENKRQHDPAGSVTAVSHLSVRPGAGTDPWALEIIVESPLGPRHAFDDVILGRIETLTLDEFDEELHALGVARIVTRLQPTTASTSHNFAHWIEGLRTCREHAQHLCPDRKGHNELGSAQ